MVTLTKKPEQDAISSFDGQTLDSKELLKAALTLIEEGVRDRRSIFICRQSHLYRLMGRQRYGRSATRRQRFRTFAPLLTRIAGPQSFWNSRETRELPCISMMLRLRRKFASKPSANSMSRTLSCPLLGRQASL